MCLRGFPGGGDVGGEEVQEGEEEGRHLPLQRGVVSVQIEHFFEDLAGEGGGEGGG